MSSEDSNAEHRKKDHIELAFASQTPRIELDERFYYEPLLSGHPANSSKLSLTFLGKQLKAPIWVSSMTGGAQKAGIINRNLARACNEFGLGMGLGSCRSLLYSDDYLADFALRDIIGHQPFYANLGIAQVEQLLRENKLSLVSSMLTKLEADGLIIHVNPLQEWMQPEGDKYYDAPLTTIQKFLQQMPEVKVIVKEVGQGMGYQSLEALMLLPIQAIEFAAYGGTNFTKLELFRKKTGYDELSLPLTQVGHTAEEMIGFINDIHNKTGQAKEIIISGGIKTFLDGYHAISRCQLPSVYGQASAFLKHATGSYEELRDYVSETIDALALAANLLKVKRG